MVIRRNQSELFTLPKWICRSRFDPTEYCDPTLKNRLFGLETFRTVQSAYIAYIFFGVIYSNPCSIMFHQNLKLKLVMSIKPITISVQLTIVNRWVLFWTNWLNLWLKIEKIQKVRNFGIFLFRISLEIISDILWISNLFKIITNTVMVVSTLPSGFSLRLEYKVSLFSYLRIQTVLARPGNWEW